MKSVFKVRSVVLTLIIVACTIAVETAAAQVTGGIKPPPITQWFSQLDAWYGGVVILGGYLSFLIPGLNKISSGVYRVLTFALLAGIGFFVYGSDIWSLALTYFFSTSMYELFLKGILKSPKPK